MGGHALMAVYSCTGPDGRPGYLWGEQGQGVATECHVYDEGDEQGRKTALRLAIRDQVASKGAVAQETTVPLGG